MNIVLLLAYERPGGNPLGIARITDRTLITMAANGAIAEAREIADRYSKDDPLIADVCQAEVSKLENSLSKLIPGLLVPSVVM